MSQVIKSWIKNHQVAAFFLLAFLITWPGFFLTFFAILSDKMWKKLPEDHPAVVKLIAEKRTA